MTELQEKLGSQLQLDIPIASFTTFRIGGPAKYFYVAENSEDIVKAVRAAVDLKIPYFILGAGSNVLVSDNGFPGLVIRMKNEDLRIKNDRIVAGAGALNAAVVQASVDAGLTGLEWCAGIPGSIGGSVRGNAGAYGGEMKDAVKGVKTLRTTDYGLRTTDFTNEQCQFGYRDSIFKRDGSLIILEVEIGLEKGDKEKIKSRVREILQKRTRLPCEPSSGCVFQNVKCKMENVKLSVDQLPEQYKQWGKIPAAWLIEQAGLKGKQIGGAKVALEQGNFIVNVGGATAQDVIMLISYIKQQIRDKFGIQLQEEVQLVG